MDHGNYSHVLNIKIISKTTRLIINDENLLETIKELFLQKKQYFDNVKLVWRRIKWKGMNKYFDIGDIVIDSVFYTEQILLDCVRSCLQDITKELHNKGLLSTNQLIIFKLIKPLVENLVILPDTL